MKNTRHSTDIDIQQCVINAGKNKFDLILIAAVRAREIKRRNILNPDQSSNTVAALFDVQDGNIGKEYLKKVR